MQQTGLSSSSLRGIQKRLLLTSTAFASVVLAASLSATPLFAATIEAPSRIDQVTLYPDAALIRRTLTIDIPAGSHDVTISDLPFALDANSLRIEGSAEGRLMIGGAETRLKANLPGKAKPDAEKRLKALRLEQDRVQDKIDAVEGRKAMIQKMAQNPHETEAKGKTSQGLDLESWTKAWDLVGKGLDLANSEIRFFRIEEARIHEEIAALEAAGTAKPDAQPHREAVIAVEMASAGKATLHLSYRVSGASWRPVYDARLATTGAKPELDLTRRAMIRQNTGEDWNEASLTLSTIFVRRGTAAPDLSSERAGIFVPPPPGSVRPMAKMAMDAAEMQNRVAMGATQRVAAAPAAMPEAAPVEEASASVEASGFQAQFSVPGKVSIASNGTEKSVRLGAQKAEPHVLIKASPALDPTAYLEAAFTHTGDAPLLPGEVLLTRDGAFIGKARLPLVAKGDKAKLGFGADDQVKITRLPLAREAKEAGFLGSTRSEERSFKTLVKNFHPFPADLLVQDRIPISEEQNVVIERLPEMSKPDLENLDDKRGVFGYSFKLKPQDERSLITAYRIRWPQDKEIRIMPLPR